MVPRASVDIIHSFDLILNLFSFLVISNLRYPENNVTESESENRRIKGI